VLWHDPACAVKTTEIVYCDEQEEEEEEVKEPRA